ncbi:unnamed protein product [Linum tenue]|uniref:Uncharacterized protein n=1 Tax=Linum tenue TaxID=586396 RepID=A0AAV0JWC2_9ROSI|nr:unnamed protein product [Linum tenue]
MVFASLSDLCDFKLRPLLAHCLTTAPVYPVTQTNHDLRPVLLLRLEAYFMDSWFGYYFPSPLFRIYLFCSTYKNSQLSPITKLSSSSFGGKKLPDSTAAAIEEKWLSSSVRPGGTEHDLKRDGIMFKNEDGETISEDMDRMRAFKRALTM